MNNRVQSISFERLYSAVRIAAGLVVGMMLGFMTLSVSILG